MFWALAWYVLQRLASFISANFDKKAFYFDIQLQSSTLDTTGMLIRASENNTIKEIVIKVQALDASVKHEVLQLDTKIKALEVRVRVLAKLDSKGSWWLS